MKDNIIVFETEDGGEAEFSVLEQTTLGGVNYLLVVDEEDEDGGSFLVLKENRNNSADEMAAFDIVEDEKELEAVIKIFNELLEDVDLEV
ncbi:MAG: DUF1292 domain-containing protein [Coprococcus sp.]